MLNRIWLRMMACSNQQLRSRRVPELLQLLCERYDRSQPEQPSELQQLCYTCSSNRCDEPGRRFRQQLRREHAHRNRSERRPEQP